MIDFHSIEVSLDHSRPGFVAQYLNPGLSIKNFEKLSNGVLFRDELIELFKWRNGTKFNQFLPGENIEQAARRVAFLRDPYFIFRDFRRVLSGRDLVAKYINKCGISGGMEDYVPIFYDGMYKYLIISRTPGSDEKIYLIDTKNVEVPKVVFHSLTILLSSIRTTNG